MICVRSYNRAVNTVSNNSPVPALAFAAFITGALIGGGWALSANVRLQGTGLYLLLLAGFVVSAGRPRWLNAPETFFTPSAARSRRS